MESADDPKAKAAALHSLSLIVRVTLAFFDKYLRNEKDSLLDTLHDLGPEISVKHYSAGTP